ncbi:MAG: sigma-70 family RNA polymerase sigma factor [Myxococcales bacterium]|jgi:RNA polymerase sigma-70 factor (ECF subfamily)|nr:sigma-70 family RNA polymerase sigma factor [Myxococcales bacterium]
MTTALMDRIEPHSPASRAGSEVDPATLARAQQGDATAVERFVRHYERPVFAFLSRMAGRGPHVEDLAQEVFLRAYRALPNFERRENTRVSTWLFSIAWRLCIDRSRKPRPPLLSVESVPLRSAACPDQDHRRSRIASALELAVGELPREQRAAFLLAECHGLTTAEIAQVTDTTRATVKTRLFRARARLKRSLRAIWEEER